MTASPLPVSTLFPAAGPAPEGFFVHPRDARQTVAQIRAKGRALAITCAACRRAIGWSTDRLAALPPHATVAQLAHRMVCSPPETGGAGCGSHEGTLVVLRPPNPRRRSTARHVTPRDIARIKAMAESVTETYQPPVLDDLDAPMRVGAFLPGRERYLGGNLAGAWAGRVLVAWEIGREAKNHRRKVAVDAF